MQYDIELTSSQELILSQEIFGSIFHETVQQDVLPVISDCESELQANLPDYCSTSQQELKTLDDNLKESMPSTSYHDEEPIQMPFPDLPITSVFSLDPSCPNYVPSKLPASNNWPGDYGFDICFPPPEKKTKCAACYSINADKLYVAKSVPCHISFVTNQVMSNDTVIRVMSVFIQPEHASAIVQRCVNHTYLDRDMGLSSPDHLIRCECSQAKYETDPSTGRQSVLVPYENPAMGENFSTYIFKFMCFGSCAGGLNRRAIKVIFTLERGSMVIGRRSLDVKICASPGRDIQNDEKQESSPKSTVKAPSSSTCSRKRKKVEETNSNILDIFQFVKRINSERPSSDGIYTLTIYDREEYEFLKKFKSMYEMAKHLNNMKPESLEALEYSLLRVKKETTDESE